MRLPAGVVAAAARHWPLSLFLAAMLLAIMIPHMLERMIVYYPAREVMDTPESIGLSFQDVFLETEDGVRLHGWYLPCAEAKNTLIIFHGNAGNIGHRVEWLGMLKSLALHILIIDYRGYGKSGGQPFENGLYRDASAAYGWWMREHSAGGQKLIVLGESLGGAVAVDLASRVRVDGLILQSTFTNAWDMAKTILPIGLVQPLLGVHFDSESKIRKVVCPKLFFHGTRDDIVPLRLGRKLYDAAMSPKLFFEIEGAGHNDLIPLGGTAYLERISNFLAEVGRP
jgi:hypothetical protein